MTVSPQMARRGAAGRGMMDLGQYPYGHWLTYKAALAQRDLMLARPRPWHPHGQRVDLLPPPEALSYPGTVRQVRPCFGRCGYGDGMLGTGTCHRTRCEDADDCYRLMRQIVEATDSRMPDFNTRLAQLRSRLVARGMDAMAAGHAAMQELAGGPHPRPLEDAMLANAQLGRIDSGTAARCASCTRVPDKSVMVNGLCPRCAKANDLPEVYKR